MDGFFLGFLCGVGIMVPFGFLIIRWQAKKDLQRIDELKQVFDKSVAEIEAIYKDSEAH